MSGVLLNRVCIALSAAGLFVAGFLSLGHLLKVEVPCGLGGGGCARVAADPSSYFLNIPIAYFGAAMYLVVLGLSAYRATLPPEQGRRFVALAFWITAVAAVVSLGLQVYSLSVIRQFCPWCAASAVLAVALFVLHAVLLQSGLPVNENPKSDLVTLGVFGVLALAGLGVSAATIASGPKQVTVNPEIGMTELVPEDAHIKGVKDAPITILEFGDLMCPVCARNHPLVKSIVERSNGRVRLVFRHFPLFETKQFSLPASILAEYAGTKGKFFEYLDLVYKLNEEEVQDDGPLFAIIRSLNLSVDEARKALDDTEGVPFSRVYRDRGMADKLGLTGTPVYMILADGIPPKTVQGSAIEATLNSPPYKALMEGS